MKPVGIRTLHGLSAVCVMALGIAALGVVAAAGFVVDHCLPEAAAPGCFEGRFGARRP